MTAIRFKPAGRPPFEAVEVYHCRLAVQLPLGFLPDKPLREMRFRCRRCGALLSHQEARAKWTRQSDAVGVPKSGNAKPVFEV